MRHFLHLGTSKSLPKHGLLHIMHAQIPHHMMMAKGYGMPAVHKKDVGSMKPLSGAGVKKHIAPLRFKM